MKIMHLSDLHIGKKLIDVSLLEDQKYIFEQILDSIDHEKPDAVLIAGDVYDRSAPSAEAMEFFNWLLNELADRKQNVMIISGNHDSAERLNFAGDFLKRSHIHVSPVYDGHIEPICIPDEYGEVFFWLMPYIHPDNVARFFPEQTIRNAHEAAKAVIDEMKVDPAQRNVILSHQFITGGTTSDSERRSIGTIEDVNAALYDQFDYVALGHLHRPQNVGRENGTMRYCGTPLMYSVSELSTEKTITMVQLGGKGEVEISEIPLQPKRVLYQISGLFDELIQNGPKQGNEEDFFYIRLNDEEDIPNAAARLRERFPNMLAMSYDNKRTRSFQRIDAPEAAEKKQPIELMKELYQLTHHEEMNDEAIRFAMEVMKETGGLQV